MTPAPTLTKPQELALRVLSAASGGPVAVHGRTRPGGISPTSARVAWTPTSRLVKAGLAEWTDGPSWYSYARITPAGLGWLERRP